MNTVNQNTPQAILFFENKDSALTYRKTTGCGGWVFAAEDGHALLYPFGMAVNEICTHPTTHGQSGTFFC